MNFQRILLALLKSYLLFSLAVAVVVALIYPFVDATQGRLIAYNLLFMFVITGISGGFLAITFNKQHTYFMGALGGSIFLKMFLSLGYLYILITTYRPEALLIIASFFLFYFLFTGFEVYQIMYKLRPQLKRNQTSENS